MKKKYVILFLLCFYCKENVAQSLIWLPFYKAKTKNTSFYITLYREFKLRFRNEHGIKTILPKHGNRPLLRVSMRSIVEVFDDRFLVVSIPTSTIWDNGEPDFFKNRDTLYFIDLKKRKARKNILWTSLEGKKLMSNAIELTLLNKKRDYNYALKDVSFAEKKITLFSFDSLKMVTMPLQRL